MGPGTLGYRLQPRNPVTAFMPSSSLLSIADYRIPAGESPTQALALDTEFLRERTYWPQLALLQLRQGDQTLLLDPLEAQPNPDLRQRIQRAQPTIMHAPGEDLVCLQHQFGWLPGKLFDTQLAASYVGRGVGLGYAALVAQLLGEHVDKGETRSDWLQRPLSDAQLAYAAVDVVHLQAMHALLQPQLEAAGLLAWFEEDCAAMLRRAGVMVADPFPHLDFKPSGGMPRLAQARIRRCLLWREQVARERDRPRTWILDNDAVLALALADLDKPGAIAQLLSQRGRAIRGAERELEPVLLAPLDEQEQQMPLAPRPDQHFKDMVTRMQHAVADFATRTRVPKEILLARRHLESYALSGEWPGDKSGWRQAALEPVLAAIRAG